MAGRSALIRSVQLWSSSEACFFCTSRRLLQPPQTPTGASNSLSWRRSYASGSRAAQDARTEMDRRTRTDFYTLVSGEGLIDVDRDAANRMFEEFQALEKTHSPSDTARKLASRYKLTLAKVTHFALVTYRIPESKDPKRRLPASQHKPIAGRILKACAVAKEPTAVLHILSAVYVSSLSNMSMANDIAKLFTRADVLETKSILAELASDGNAEAMTLQGLFLELDGKKQETRVLYEKALDKVDLKYKPTHVHPMAMPLVTPWDALGSMLLASNDAQAREQAKAVLKKGAVKGDDPLAYWKLACLEDRMSVERVKYLSKAAASGHVEAMYSLGNFYMDVASDTAALSKATRLRRALNWLLDWRENSAHALGREWFNVAADCGHKPSMLEMAELYSVEGDVDKTRAYWQTMADAPEKGKTEEWPQLVEYARKKLSGSKIARPVLAQR